MNIRSFANNPFKNIKIKDFEEFLQKNNWNRISSQLHPKWSFYKHVSSVEVHSHFITLSLEPGTEFVTEISVRAACNVMRMDEKEFKNSLKNVN